MDHRICPHCEDEVHEADRYYFEHGHWWHPECVIDITLRQFRGFFDAIDQIAEENKKPDS